MADITPLIRRDQKIIQSYAGGQFRISGEVFTSAVIVLPDFAAAWNVPPGGKLQDLSEQDFAPLFERGAEVLLLGCGARVPGPMPVALRQALRAQGLVADMMDTGAACRTYNVLMAEGRRVAAALLPV